MQDHEHIQLTEKLREELKDALLENKEVEKLSIVKEASVQNGVLSRYHFISLVKKRSTTSYGSFAAKEENNIKKSSD